MTRVADEDLRETVRALREDGRSPKQIAMALGLPRGQILALVQEAEDVQHPGKADPGLVGCWISPGWRVDLTVEERYRAWPGWSDLDSDKGRAGVVSVLVARDDRRGGKISVCGYLVDAFCLGVKNALGPESMTRRELHEFKQLYFALWDTPPHAAPIELARHLVFGAVEYARGLGFEPHPDFEPAAGHLGSWSGPSAITFGCGGRPTYVSGPYDDPQAIVRTLERSVGKGNFDFSVATALS